MKSSVEAGYFPFKIEGTNIGFYNYILEVLFLWSFSQYQCCGESLTLSKITSSKNTKEDQKSLSNVPFYQ
jgi:hypothetical protein